MLKKTQNHYFRFNFKGKIKNIAAIYFKSSIDNVFNMLHIEINKHTITHHLGAVNCMFTAKSI